MKTSLRQQLLFLTDRGAAAEPHSGGSLLGHLVATRELLANWHMPPALATAGLFHSVYGTEAFVSAPVALHERAVIRAIVGREAEAIVYSFAAIERSHAYWKAGEAWVADRFTGARVHLEPHMIHALCHLEAANWVEQCGRVDPFYVALRRARFEDLLCALEPPAARAVRTLLSFIPTADR